MTDSGLKLAQAAKNILDFIEIPVSLEAGSRLVAMRYIQEFKEALSKFNINDVE